MRGGCASAASLPAGGALAARRPEGAGGSVRLASDRALQRQTDTGHGQGDGDHGDHVEARERQRSDVAAEPSGATGIAWITLIGDDLDVLVLVRRGTGPSECGCRQCEHHDNEHSGTEGPEAAGLPIGSGALCFMSSHYEQFQAPS
jgi:hypothetical protein